MSRRLDGQIDRREHFAHWLKENHSGIAQAINAKSMKQWGSRREIRHIVHTLRREGHPICSGNSGYYYAATRAELDATLSWLDSMQEDLVIVIQRLNETREQWGE